MSRVLYPIFSSVRGDEELEKTDWGLEMLRMAPQSKVLKYRLLR